MSSAATVGAGQPVEQRRFAGIGVADQRDHRIRHAARAPRDAAPGCASTSSSSRLQPGDALADQPAVDFELALARAAEKAEPAALAFEMGPGPHQPRALVGQRRQLDLQAALMGARARAEDFEDQAGAVDDLGLPAPFEIALLHRAQRRVDDDQPDRRFRRSVVARASRPCRCRTSVAGRGRASATISARTTSRSMACASPTASSSRASSERLGASELRPAGDFVAGWTTSARPVDGVSSARIRWCSGSSSRLLAGFEELDRLRRHDRRDRVLVDELRMRVAPQQHAEIVEPGNDALAA